MKLVRSLAVLAALVMPGCVFTNVVVPLDEDVSATQFGDKTGRAHSHMVLGLAAWGDRGTKAAADHGAITTVRHMDIQYFAILWPVYARTTTIVYGD